jgi:septal ring factor EnvC (AmiA/AmiB activator)
MRQVDARRDLNAQMRADLEQAEARLERTLAVPLSGGSAPADAGFLPLKPFRGALDWPIEGRVVSRFGQQRTRLGMRLLQNGIEVEAAVGTPVRAVHEGRVTFADVFAGFGQLVILDHGNLGFSLYGYLGSARVAKGSTVSAGQVIGTSGRAPGGNAAAYFELRIDGKPVDPLQWLKVKSSTTGPGGTRPPA